MCPYKCVVNVLCKIPLEILQTKYNTFYITHKTGPNHSATFLIFFVPLFSSFRNVHPIIRLTDARLRFPDGNRRKLTSTKETAIPVDPISKQTPWKSFRHLSRPFVSSRGTCPRSFLVFLGKQDPTLYRFLCTLRRDFPIKFSGSNHYSANVSLTITGR